MVSRAASDEYPTVTRLSEPVLAPVDLHDDHRQLPDSDLPNAVAAHVVGVHRRRTMDLLVSALVQRVSDDLVMIVDSDEYQAAVGVAEGDERLLERLAASTRLQLDTIALSSDESCVPAPVVAEVARSASRRSGVDQVLRRLPVIDTDRAIATRAGHLLGRTGLDSCHAVDVFVVATALGAGPAVILTGDADDFARLVGDDLGVHVRPLP